METFTRRVAIAGQVTDAETGAGIGGALVSISGGPKPFLAWLAIRKAELASRGVPAAGMPDVAVTGADGWFHFDALPDGKYALDFGLPAAGTRYGTAKLSVKVRAGEGAVKPTDASAALPPTTVRGRVADAGGASVPMAEVRIKGSGEKTFSGVDGRYRLVGVERGARTVQVQARGAAAAEAVAQLPDPGSSATLDFTVSPG
ncbi:MAG: hypothetical protein JWM27_4348 [Gemmatimonadetes bacterium]|nr:hypothetical protein [Gemmatimonadota bacterium]